MRVHYKISIDDFFEAHRTRNYTMLRIRQIVGAVMIATGIFVVIVDLNRHKPILFGLGYMLLGLYFVFSWTVTLRNAYKRDQRLNQEFDNDINEDGILITTPLPSSKSSWDSFVRWIETPNLFVLYQRSRAFIFPKRAFGAGELDQFRDLLAHHVSQRKPRNVQLLVFLGVLLLSAILLAIVILKNH
jgi:hypothetical protein